MSTYAEKAMSRGYQSAEAQFHRCEELSFFFWQVVWGHTPLELVEVSADIELTVTLNGRRCDAQGQGIVP